MTAKAAPVVPLDRGWLAEGACTRPGARETFLALSDRAGWRAATLAAKICDTCPVLDACRDYATRAEVTAGFWAGQFYGWRETVCPKGHNTMRVSHGERYCRTCNIQRKRGTP